MEKKLNLRFQKCPNDGFVHEERLIQWLDPDTGEIARRPQPEKKITPRVDFTAGGKSYFGTKALLHECLDKERGIYRDIYGCTVVEAWERYPCFDSYDYAYEKRYFHWLYLRNGNQLTCVHFGDDYQVVEVTDDAAEITGTAWNQMVWNEVVTKGEYSSLILDDEEK